ncbi:MAG: AlkZ family DNA glycosylase [Deltaproteobacteria bacterium]|nr:AlkZ family DNA glycosylase [Deltaproteobacteria bacterium]
MESLRGERLANQLLTRPASSPAAVVSAMVAIQAQEFGWAKWALALRSGASDAAIEKAFAGGAILRTHPMRGTHHFVAPADVRWLLALLLPRTLVRTGPRHGRLGLDPKTLAKALDLIARALEGGHAKTRAELGAVLTRAKISPEGQRLPHILMHGEVTSLLCSGPRRGKDITFMLLDDRAPAQKPRPRTEALADLATRYFTTRGPATVRDFVWWSTLTTADAKLAIGEAGLHADATGHIRGAATTKAKPAGARLLPMYDEYLVSYAARDLAGVAPAHEAAFLTKSMLGTMVEVAGEIVGTWTRTTTGALKIHVTPWRKLAPREQALVEEAAVRFAAFVGREVASFRVG